MTPDETQAASARPRAENEAVDAVVEGWSRLFAYLLIATLTGFTVILPFPGLLLAFAGACYLRAGDVHSRRHHGGLLRLLAGPVTAPLDLVRGSAATLVSVPYAAAVAVATPFAIVAVAVVDVTVHPLVAAGWGAGAGAYVLLAGPGIRVPRRRLIRIFAAFARRPRRIAALGGLLCVLALGAVAAAIVVQPTFSPLYQLRNSMVQELGRFQHSIQHRVS